MKRPIAIAIVALGVALPGIAQASFPWPSQPQDVLSIDGHAVPLAVHAGEVVVVSVDVTNVSDTARAVRVLVEVGPNRIMKLDLGTIQPGAASHVERSIRAPQHEGAVPITAHAYEGQTEWAAVGFGFTVVAGAAPSLVCSAYAQRPFFIQTSKLKGAGGLDCTSQVDELYAAVRLLRNGVGFSPWYESICYNGTHCSASATKFKSAGYYCYLTRTDAAYEDGGVLHTLPSIESGEFCVGQP